MGKGISLERFKEFMSRAHRLLALEIASVPEHEKRAAQQKHLGEMVAAAKHWPALT